MGRKQSYTESELLDITKRLVLEHGYDGFHLKLLSQHLPGARSTIYQYYSNKEELRTLTGKVKSNEHSLCLFLFKSVGRFAEPIAYCY